MRRADAKWLGNGYTLPRRWMFKKDMPPMNPGVRPLLVAFRFEVAMVARDEQMRILMPDGTWLPTFEFILNPGGRCIGPQDMSCADNTPMSEAWRNACVDKRLGN